jgi:rod shape-determining protein MreC
MAGMDHAPPPFFKRGPAPLALLTFYIAVSLAIFVFDLRFKSLELLRQSIALVVDPVQRVAQTPAAWSTTPATTCRACIRCSRKTTSSSMPS